MFFTLLFPYFLGNFHRPFLAVVAGELSRDLGLDARVTYITPRYEFGQAHLDGTALVLGRDLEETVANIARFSRRDAATFREWNRKAEEMTARILLPSYRVRVHRAQAAGLRLA